MPEEDVRTLFDAFDAENGGEPLPHEEPTGDQLQALREVLRSDKAPYADFGVWGPYGRRQSKLLKFQAMVFVGGSLQQKQLTGPHNFVSWRRCWCVFRTAMVLLRGSKPGPLDAYEENIRSLAEVFGDTHWGIISRADDVMRSEGWERRRRVSEDEVRRGVYRKVFDPAMPWAAVLRD